MAISSYSAQISEAYALADRYRELGVPVVMGGLHVSALPEEALVHCDSVALGEGESAWIRILHDAQAGRLESVYKDSGEFDLSAAPMPSFRILDMQKYNRLTVQASRGCPMHCEFCASSVLLTHRYKQKPVGRVLQEIDGICALWPRPFIEFADDNAFVNRRYWKELLPRLAARRLRWFAETDLSFYEDEELMTMARRGGCVEVLIGLESPFEAGLEGLELKGDWKRKRWGEYRQAVRSIQSHGIRVNGCFMIGLDDHTPDIFDAVLEFARDTELFDVQITIPTPFPGTPFYERLKSEGRLLYDGVWDRCTLFDINYRPKCMTTEELRNGFHRLAAKLYGDEMTKWRRENFNSKYLRGMRH